jgi:Family of unknown function (DUF5681)
LHGPPSSGICNQLFDLQWISLVSETDYRIGRGKPPLSSRFKPGASGNPSGRPKRTPTLHADLLDELAEPAAASATKQRAIVRTLVNQAIGAAGNLRVLVAVLARMQGPRHMTADLRTLLRLDFHSFLLKAHGESLGDARP